MKKLCLTATLGLIVAVLLQVGGAGAQEREQQERKAQSAPSTGELGGGIDIARTPDGFEYVRGELLVKYEDEVAKAKADKKGGKVQNKFDHVPGMEENVALLAFDETEVDVTTKEKKSDEESFEALQAKEKELEAVPGVEYAELNGVQRDQAYEPDDPYFAPGSAQWYLRAMRAQDGWSFPKALGGGVRIGVVDSGYDASHIEFCQTYNTSTWGCSGGKVVAQRDVYNGDAVAKDDVGGNSHGTYVGGIAAARTNNAQGLAGAAPSASLVIAKATQNGSGTNATLAAGINWARANDARVINVSSGSQVFSQTLSDAVSGAHNNGVTVVAAAGNWHGESEASDCSTDRGASILYPAALPQAIAVGGTSQLAPWANGCVGPEVDVSAEAGRVMGPIASYNAPAGNPPYAQRSGTSFAAPQVSGLVANIMSTSDVPPTQSEIRAALFNTTTDIGTDGKDNATGYGRVDYYRALKVAQSY